MSPLRFHPGVTFAERCVLSQIGYLSFHQSSPTLDRSPNSAVHTVFTRVSGRSTVCSPVDNSMDKSTNGVKSQSVSKSQNNISRLGQPWDNGGTNLLFTGMNDDSKQKAQVLDSFGLFLWCPGRGERIRTSGLYVPNAFRLSIKSMCCTMKSIIWDISGTRAGGYDHKTRGVAVAGQGQAPWFSCTVTNLLL